MNTPLKFLWTLAIAVLGMSVIVGEAAEQPQDHLVFEPTGQSNGKHVVLIAGDEEYRSEEALPMLAQILAKQGFKTTVLFSMDRFNTVVEPDNNAKLNGANLLTTADAMVLSIRFRKYSKSAMPHFVKAFERGVPIIAMRTSTHAFNFSKKHPYHKYSWNAKADTGWEGGFGRQVLGETWVAHHGKHKEEGTRTYIEKANRRHPVLNGVGQIFCTTDVYAANPLQPSKILLRGAVTESLDPKSKEVKSKNTPMQPVAWIREYKHESGVKNKVFTTTMGAATDFLDSDLRRLVVNAVYWGVGMEVPKKVDVALVSQYHPNEYGFKEYRRGVTPSDLIALDKTDPIYKDPFWKIQNLPVEITDVGHPEPTAGKPPKALQIKKGSHIAFVGGGLGSRMNRFNEFETTLQRRYPDYKLYIRNLCHEGDTPAFRPHPSRKSHWVIDSLEDQGKSLVKKEYQRGGGKGHYETPDLWMSRHKVDTVIGFFGYSESFDGVAEIDRYKEELRAFIKHTLHQTYSGRQPQLAIISPAAFEDLSAKYDLPDGRATNKRLAAYSKAMKEVCDEEGILFVDAYQITEALYKANADDLTSNGNVMNAKGYKLFAPELANALFGQAKEKADYETVKAAVAEKNRLWYMDYKVPNGVHVHGRRFAPFGSVNYPHELRKIRQMTHIRDRAIWAANIGKKYNVKGADAKTQVLPEIKTNSGRKVAYKSGKEVEDLLEVAPGYKVELFADEKQFPALANPSQIAFDNKGRLWVGCMGTYPHYKIGDPEPEDKIIILKDTDNDGKADKQTVFADNIHIPMGFEITEHGVFVSLGKDLVLFKDTDGDDKADTREVVLSGFDDHDTHHAISSFCADPSGAILMGEGTFSHTSVETPYGPVRGTNGGFYRYNPNKKRLERTAQYSIPNPWGIAIDQWGQNFFLHTSGTAFSWMQETAIKPRYGINLRASSLVKGPNAVRPTSGTEFISSRHFPDEVQGDVLICNNIGFLGAKQWQIKDTEEGYYKTTFRQDLFQSPKSYQYFRPVDLEFAPDGSLYFIDWSNVLIGHMQHSARDPKRDHMHGRVYRVTYPSRPLVPVAKVHGASISELLENLKLPEIRTRYRTRRELRGRDHVKVLAATRKWVRDLNKKDPNYEHHVLEAMWVTWGINRIDTDILNLCLKAKNYKARAAATRAVRYNMDKLSNGAELLKTSANDEHPQVRHEAIIAATWINPTDGTEVIQIAQKKGLPDYSKAAAGSGLRNLKDQPAIEPTGPKVPVPSHLKNDKKAAELYVKGHHFYHEGENCTICHQAHGNGVPNAFPPLNKSPYVTGSKELLGKITLHGIQGKMTVNGKPYQGLMQGFLHRFETDEEAAAVMTYVRNAWDNKTGDKVTVSEVKALKAKTKNQADPYKASDLMRKYRVK